MKAVQMGVEQNTMEVHTREAVLTVVVRISLKHLGLQVLAAQVLAVPPHGTLPL